MNRATTDSRYPGTAATHLLRYVAGNFGATAMLAMLAAASVFIALAPPKISLMAALGLIAAFVYYAYPEIALYLLFSAVILTFETVSDNLAASGGMLLLEDINVAKGIPPLTIAMLLLLFVVYFTKRLVIEGRSSNLPLRYLFFYAALLLIPLATGLHRGTGLMDIKNDLIRFSYPALCFYLCVNILDTRTKLVRMIWIVFLACLVKTAILDLNFLLGHGYPYDDYKVVTMDSAVLMASGIMIMVGLALLVQKGLRAKGTLPVLIGLLPMVFALVFSYRRGHWAGQIASLALLYLWIPREARKTVLMSVLGIIMIAACSYFVLAVKSGDSQQDAFMSSRIESLLDPDQHSNKHHYLESVTTLQDIMQTPLTGMGLGGVHSPVSEDIIDWPEEGQPVHVVHNTFIHVWMKLGLPGLLFFIWIGAVYLRTLNGYRRRAARNDTWPFLAGIASGIGIWLVMFITGPVPWYFHQTFLIALFSGICLNLIRLEGAEARHGEPATTSGANNV